MKNTVIDNQKPVVRNLIMLSKEIRCAFGYFAEANFPKDLSQAECRMIEYLCAHPGCLSVDAAEDFHFVKSTVSTLVKSLEEKGYIRTECSTVDKRKTHLYPTEKALEAHSEIGRFFDQYDAMLESGLTEEEKSVLLSAFQKIENNIEEVRK